MTGADTEERLSDKQFTVLSRFIEDHCGIKMPPAKRLMLEARLRKRLRITGKASFKEYLEYVFSSAGVATELVHMVDQVTTNKTDFFREPHHFDFLVKTALPDLMARYGAGSRKQLMGWSAGCSSGEEPYTLAIVLSEVAEKLGRMDFMILATDISTKVLTKAAGAIYEEERIAPVPMNLRKKYLLKSRDHTRKLVRIVPELRERVKFRRLNFMDDDFGMREPFHFIFCRNVFIYFDRPTQERIINSFCKNLVPGGYIFLGHSESINGLNVPLVPLGPSIYKFPG